MHARHGLAGMLTAAVMAAGTLRPHEGVRMNREFGGKAFLAALTAPILGLPLFGPATAESSIVRATGPCYVVDINDDDVKRGARSVCPPGTWRHWHQVHVTCKGFITRHDEHGPMVGGTSVSEVLCPSVTRRSDSWNTQGPDE
ncbi:hypothetical protein AB0F17_56715 [Nonomuraea sp. NPDC026600]|uniref:hypothetical protein n=1 Tax=Nonomuraea sp. NPDC026600 TaxID=3155363 RepID=UPI0033F8B45B